MDIQQLLINTFMVASLAMPVVSKAETVQTGDTGNLEHIKLDLMEIEVDTPTLLPPKLSTTGEILYLSGGIGIDDLNQIKKIAPTFSLELVLVERTDAYYRESYIADVRVNINDIKSGNTLLNVISDGPYLLADLPDGHYQITATFNGIVKARKVTIDQSKHSRVVLLWDNRAPQELSKPKQPPETP